MKVSNIFQPFNIFTLKLSVVLYIKSVVSAVQQSVFSKFWLSSGFVVGPQILSSGPLTRFYSEIAGNRMYTVISREADF